MQTLPFADPILHAHPSDVRVLVVGDDPLVREGFVARLAAVAVGEAGSADVGTAARHRDANVVVWDLGPGEPAPPLLGDVDVPVVVLAAGGTASSLLAAGAAGVLRRDGSTAALHSALQSVVLGLAVIDPSLLDAPRPRSESLGAEVESLTTRETEVLELVAAGLSNKQIADRLGISTHTVKFHVNAILAKLDVHSRTEAVVRAVQLGVVML
jgi:two-component system, NarL family, nitrate/nitrite response regulator NarL